MNKLTSVFKLSILGILIFTLLLLAFLRLRYGGGSEYKDLSSNPLYSSQELELYFSYPEPIGNVAASNDTMQSSRVFFTVHPESRPSDYKLIEIINNKAVPYPSEAAQKELFTTVLGVYCDRQNRLWTIDHGNHGFGDVKLIGFDLSTNQIVHEYTFPEDVAEKLSFFNDLSVSPDGQFIFVADVSFFGKKPSLVVYNIENGTSKSLLDEHPSVSHEGYVPVTPAKKMRFFGGAVDLLTGIDGIEVSPDGKQIYYAAMGNSGLFSVPYDLATNFSTSQEALSSSISRVADKPLSDGIRCDQYGRVYITDIEHQGIYVHDPLINHSFTLIKDERIRWADGLSLGTDNYFYLADSDIPNQMLQSKSHMARNAPYHIFRFKSLPLQY